MAYEIAPQPPRAGPSTLAFGLTDAGGNKVTGARVTLEADMSHAGMRPVFADAKETQPGRYVAHVVFTMAGDWVILLHITLADGRKVERQIEVRGVGAA